MAKHIGLLIGGLLITASAASAQATSTISFRPYMFVAPGGMSSGPMTMHAGGGFDVVGRSGLGGGVELGYVGPFPDGFDYGIGLLSVNGSYHVPRTIARRATPFVTAGYTTPVLRGRSENLFNVGGGLEYWFTSGTALRLEFRDHVKPGEAGHLWGARVGFSWGR